MPRRRTGVSAAVVWAVGAAGAGALLTGCGSGASSATRLAQASDAQVVTAAGQTVAARPGLTLHVGDEIRTGAGGAAVLTTGDRKAYLGGQGSYTVRGRSAGILRRGAFVVDGRHGPALAVTAGPVTAQVGRSAVRLERGFAVRVGVLAGRAVTVSADPATGPQQLAVPSLYQAVVAGRGLNGTSPLALTDDDAERLVAPDLVADDVTLARTASALDTGSEGRAIVAVVAAAGVKTTARLAQVSETALPMAMARASSADRGVFAKRYQDALTYRAEGGSWGVVARLVGTDATATGRAIDALLVGVPSAGTVLAAAPAGPTGTGSASGTRSTGSSGNSPGGNDDGSNNPPSGSSPGPHPTPSPSPSPGALQQVVDGVLGVLPPVPAPSTASKTTKPCVLGLLNC